MQGFGQSLVSVQLLLVSDLKDTSTCYCIVVPANIINDIVEVDLVSDTQVIQVAD